MTALCAQAAVYALLANGRILRGERCETRGEMLRIYTRQGWLEVARREVTAFQVEEDSAAVEPEGTGGTPALPPNPVGELELLKQAAVAYGLRPEFVVSVAQAESALRQDAVSPKGAIGLMQLMPTTAAQLRVDPKDAAQNAHGGARYLRQLLERYRHHPDFVRLALAAYNAGPGKVDRYGTIPPYSETQRYVEQVIRRYLAALKN